jgi:HEAT repeat protein
VQKEAIAALGRLRALAGVPELLSFLKSDVAELRRSAAYALGEIRTPLASAALRELADDVDIEVRKAAARALAAIAQEKH